MKIKKGDSVKIMAGKERGKTGKVVQAFPGEGKIVVEGANKLFKHAKTRKRGDKGQKVEFFAPLAVQNVMLVCPKCAKPARVGYKVLADGKKVRTCRTCDATIE